ncbi:hypothetical protein C8R47DRAFT_1241277 [Mycena vitilis]|nr:hypothetical protein C8R47DRAFT_1241277 [Mycena vitilis]
MMIKVSMVISSPLCSNKNKGQAGTSMLLSLLRHLLCFPSTYAEYDPLGTVEPTWPAASLPTPVGPVTRLPPEMLHLVLGCVDSTMLASCSLVCTSWMVPARAHMFCRLSISMSNAHRFGRLFIPPARVSFGSHVREIELDHTIIGDFWTAHVLPRLIVNFPHLSTLVLFGAVPTSFPTAFQVVTGLEMNYVSNPRLAACPGRIARFISGFTHLETLKLTQENGPYVDFRALSEASRPPPYIRRLELDSPLILPWLTSTSPAPLVESVRVDISRPDSLKALESLQKLSMSLHALEFVLSEIEVAESFLKHPCPLLAPHTQLRSLRIQADHALAAHILLSLLSSIDTSLLADISLDFAIPYLDVDGPVLTLLPWGALDAALAALPALRRVTVVKVLVSPPGWRSRLSQRTVLPDAAARLPLCRDFGVGVAERDGSLISRPPSRAAGSKRFVTDLRTV